MSFTSEMLISDTLYSQSRDGKTPVEVAGLVYYTLEAQSKESSLNTYPGNMMWLHMRYIDSDAHSALDLVCFSLFSSSKSYT